MSAEGTAPSAAAGEPAVWRRWSEIEPLFDSAMELEPADRAAFLLNATQKDAELRSAVEELLHRVERTAGYLGVPAVDAYAEFAADLTQSQAAMGERIGSYRIVGAAGRGGMGIVYIAERADDQYRSRVALKVLKEGLDDPVFVRRFQDERQILASLEHPHIARLYDGGVTEDGRPWFAMEYVEGLPIDEYCDGKQLPIGDRLTLFLDICDAVHYAHKGGVIHRDIKPSNILVRGGGDVKLLDFGIAKAVANQDKGDSAITRTGYRMLTPQYASPEQLRGDPVTHASDVYSLGVVLFKLLTGTGPYHAKDQSSLRIEHEILEQEADRASVAIERADDNAIGARSTTRGALRRQLRGDLDAILSMALRKEPERRYPTVEAFAADIKRQIDGFPVMAQRGAWAYRAKKFVRRRRAPILGIVAALALTGGALETQRQVGRRSANGSAGVAMKQVTFRGDVSQATVSHDGRWLAYVTLSDSGQQVLVQNLEDNAVTRIAGGPNAFYMSLNWSRDARRLLVSVKESGQPWRGFAYERSGAMPIDTLKPMVHWTRASDQVFQFSQNGTSLNFITAIGDRPDWSRNHREVFNEMFGWLSDVAERPGSDQFALTMISSNYDSSLIWTIAVDSAHRRGAGQPDTTRTQRLLLAERGAVFALEWSAGGDALNYILAKGDEVQVRRVKVRTNGSAQSPPETRVSGLAWFTGLEGTDNDDLYFVQGGTATNVWIGRVHGTTWSLRPLTTGTTERSSPSISPDGRRVAFVMQGNVHTVDVESGHESKLTDVDSATGQTAWSRDGQALAFGIRQKGVNRVAILRSGKVTVAEQSLLSANGTLTWSSDGRILYERQNMRNFAFLNELTDEETQLLSTDSAAVGFVGHPRVSPDGRNVAFYWNRGPGGVEAGTYIIDLSNGRYRQVVAGFMLPLGWSADGRSVYVSGVATHKIMEVPLGGGLPMERARLRGTIMPGSVASGSVVLQVRSEGGDVWRIEDLARHRKR